MTAPAPPPPAVAGQQPQLMTYLVANYNNSAYIGDCLDSLQAQTGHNWRCLICDDCSTDGSPDKIRMLLASMERRDQVRLICNERNLGYVGTLRRLVDEAATDLVGILDPDDALEPEATVAVLAVYACDERIECVFSQMQSYTEDLQTAIAYDPAIYPGGVVGFAPPPGQSSLFESSYSALRTFRRRAYYRTDGFAQAARYVEDLDLMFQLEEVCHLAFIERVLYRYRRLATGLSQHPDNAHITRVNRRAVYSRAAKRRQLSAPQRWFLWLFASSIGLMHLRGGFRAYTLLRWCQRRFKIVRGEKLRRGDKPQRLPEGCILVGAGPAAAMPCGSGGANGS